MSDYMREVLSQPQLWRRGALLAKEQEALLPIPGARVALIGCGTSLYVAETVAAYREARGLGETDAFSASETPVGRHYDLLVAITRSGTTTEVLDVLRSTQGAEPQLAITALEGGPIGELTRDRIVISWADERSVVQTRFATTVLVILLAHCGWDVGASAKRAELALEEPLPDHLEKVSQLVFLGRGAAVGLAREAALKLRETVGAWTEAYPTREFRHGPISAIGPHTIVWFLDDEEPEIDAEIVATGAHCVRGSGDPLAELVRVHRAAGWLAEQRGVNPDAPRFLNRSVILD
ncbi:MAG: SIS domain-containing protein [Acidimicrobiales bacterium]